MAAVVVFTSGSEGRPKGVALSHRNLLANIHQAKSFVEINEDDVLFNPMPAFHAFGLNVGLVLPLVTGMRSYSHVNPLHVKAVPELIYDVKATVVVGTDAFAAAWGRNAHPYDFHDVRFMLVGAEKLKASTAELYVRKLNLRLFEGYGVTEASPILALGSRMRYRDGSVGRFLPDLEWRLDPAPGLAAGGRLAVRGPNVMLGYLLADRPGEIQPPPDGWHVTGDVVEVDDGGFVWLRGRLKRFAKISGEMVSLAAVEEVAGTLWPGRTLAVLARPDLVRGERLTLVVAGSDRPDLGQLRQAVRAAGLADLCAPKSLIMIKSLPMTPLGKVNLPALEAMTAGLEPEPGAGGVADDEPDDELGGEPLSELGGEPPAELEGPSVESRAGGDCSAAGAGSNGQQAG
jgi:acyl-[acyl-carrier-protein]-phospholipid O-acyltransferase/long-chain-fatty-acid--[acyl-carrier-protein] ligase